MNKSIVEGSQQDIAQKQNIPLAESFLSAEMVVIFDNSGSMGAHDAPMGQTRLDYAEKQLNGLQAKFPGKIALICFADRVEYSPGGFILSVGGSTDMKKALEFAKVADDCGLKIVLVSDGEPNDKRGTLAIAKTYQSKIDVIYVGPEYPAHGRKFLEDLALATGGNFFNPEKVGELESGVETLLLGTRK